VPEADGAAVYDRKGLARRLAQAVELAGGSARVLRESGVKASTYSRYIKEQSEASAEKLGRIAEVAGVSLDWLVLDRGAPVFEQEGEPPPLPAGPDMVMIPHSHVRPRVAEPADSRSALVEKLPFPRALLHRLGLGAGEVEFVRAVGDSMEPTIDDGALVLIDRTRKEIAGDAIYLVTLDGEARLERVRRNIDGSILLISDNRRYDPEHVGRQDVERLAVQGRACWTEKRL
jgi:phage repressor protein C with HTH and peptisase S24 domain